jgi:multicomponent Na+:H+ antiporter subunit E
MWRPLVTFVLLFVVWLAWSGHTEPLLVALGVASAALATVLGWKLGVIDEEGYPYQLALGFLTFIPWLIWEIVKANLQVARLILSPKMPIHPVLARVKASQKTEIGRVIHANTITITPGTVTLDLRENDLVVHALTPEGASQDAGGAIDRRVCRLEGSRR